MPKLGVLALSKIKSVAKRRSPRSLIHRSSSSKHANEACDLLRIAAPSTKKS
ncbi:hypothetical protein MA16_Dca012336 [Dendrobium catenatum]|uniref:Uncharacterized protein n=1 Tax=Dendrobium catenatum TaxID=906689 RepID=A0A2I0VHY3_9ASPA|nr:hypothetical protein MA16_Dca012336 [Dendrobium catenatum]